MKNRLTMLRTAMTVVFAGSAFVAAHAAEVSPTMTVDTQAPLHATLLPTVSIDADSTTSASNPAKMRVANSAPLSVTLLPTVHVSARSNPELAIVTLPTVRVTASIESAQASAERVVSAEEAGLDVPLVDDELSSNVADSLAMRARTMPR